MKIDLHCHTEASFDCVTPLSKVLARCRERGIAVQAVTDHNEIRGGEALRALAEAEAEAPTIVVGEEVSTREGEIIGLFLSRRIPPERSPEETVARIKEQGGLVLLPHGFDPLKRKRLTPAALARVAGDIDIVESFNARISHPRWNGAAGSWAAERGLLRSAGSDAHTLSDIGAAWVETPARPIRGPEDLMAALRLGTVSGEWTHPVLAFAYKVWDFGVQRVRGGRGG